ncbi:MAG: monofunctional biosynthetic peptidoglycan transglycosylase [Nitrospinae bacterium]|nr:monofunctional biosynthetic peptidoglycan transglycosylase [Nitrospinota bacterium]
MKRIIRSRWFRLGVFTVEAVGVLIIGVLVYLGQFLFVPDLTALEEGDPAPTAFMLYRQEEAVAAGKKFKLRHQWVPYKKISPLLRRAVVLTEDGLFWEHEGFDVEAIRTALETDMKEGRPKFGGSTISQQLVKNLYLSPSKNPLRKIKEALITWRLERTLSKKRILELYLNSIEWGDGIFGVEAAARHYFGVSAANLSLEQVARLAVVIPNPRKMKANGDGRYVTKRSRWVSRILVRQDPSLAPPPVVEEAPPAEPVPAEAAPLTGEAEPETEEEIIDDRP